MGCEVLNVCNIKTETIKFDKKIDFSKKDSDFKKTFESVKKNNSEPIKKNESLKQSKPKKQELSKDPETSDKVEIKDDNSKIKFSQDNKEQKLNNEEMNKLKELLESLGIEVSDEMLIELSSEFNLSSINQMIELISFINDETMEMPDFENVFDSLKDLNKLTDYFKKNSNGNKNELAKLKFTDLLGKLNGKVEKIEVSELKTDIKDNLKELVSMITKDVEEIQNLKLNNQPNDKTIEKVAFNNEEQVVNLKDDDKSIVKTLVNEKNSDENNEKEIKVSKKVVKTNSKSQSSIKNEFKENLMNFSKENEEVKENFKSELNFKLLSKVNQMNKVVDQIKNNFVTKFDGKISEMKVLLNPKSLGKVELKMTIEKGNVIAEFKVESMMVKQAIESNLQDLRNALSDKGYSIDGLNVSVNKDDQDKQQENDKYYESIFDDDQNEEKDDSISLIEESKLLNMMRRRAISYMG